MRELVYVFADGRETNSWVKAKATGEPFKTIVRKVEPKGSTIAPKRAEMLKRFGYVSAKFKDFI